MKVVHLPTTVGGNPQGISRHLSSLGVNSKTITLTQNYFGYPADIVLFSKSDGFLSRELKRLSALRYIFWCDVVFFNYGTGIYPLYPVLKKGPLARLYYSYTYAMARLEILLLKVLKKKIFVQYQGDDARQGLFSKENFDINFVDRVGEDYYSPASDLAKKKSINYMGSVADKIYALNPDLLHVLPEDAEFLPYSHISLSEWSPVYSQPSDRPLRIGHAPSNRDVKGTDLFVEAANRLLSEGHEFEVVLVEGKSNAEAKEIYKTIDVLVDQLFAGWYGGLAVEAMALGKPVVAYIREGDLVFIPDQMRKELPIIPTEPDKIYQVLKHILQTPRLQLLDLAKKSRAYVEKWHDPNNVAGRIKTDMTKILKAQS